jgi:hypothetical protein
VAALQGGRLVVSQPEECAIFIFHTSQDTTGDRVAPDLPTVDYDALSEEARLAREHAIDTFVWYALPDLKDKSLATARKLGKVIREDVEYRDSEYAPGQKLEIRSLQFDGLQIDGWVDEQKKLRINTVKVTHPRWRVRDGLGVGASIQQLDRILGYPDKRTGDVLQYSGETETAEFTVRHGRIVQVLLIHYNG